MYILSRYDEKDETVVLSEAHQEALAEYLRQVNALFRLALRPKGVMFTDVDGGRLSDYINRMMENAAYGDADEDTKEEIRQMDGKLMALQDAYKAKLTKVEL